MSSFSIGLSALRANQIGLETVGQNLANAQTPGYHRQAPEFVSADAGAAAGVQVGLGVRVADIRRFRSDLLETAINDNTVQGGSTTAELNDSRQIEGYVSPNTSGIDSLLNSFYNQLQDLMARPDDSSLRRVASGGGVALANGIQSVATNLDQLKRGVDQELQQAASNINGVTSQIAELNLSIHRAETQGLTAADQRDQRDELVNDLAKLIDVRTIEQNGQVTIQSASIPIVVGGTATPVQYQTNAQGDGQINVQGSPTAQLVTDGQLQGLLQVRNVTLPDQQNRLNLLAQTLAKSFDAIQATALGTSGPLTLATGLRSVNKTTVPLSQAGLAFPPQAGTLFISVTDPTGQRTLRAVNIDPSTQSLQDVAAAINAIGNLNALVNSQSGTLQILAAPGYSFDFAGRLSTQPTTTSFSAATPPTVQATGTYTGANNDVYTYSIAGISGPGPGSIGVTPGLLLNVTNQAGQTAASLNIGQGCAAGTDLDVGNGIKVHLSAGNVNNGDNFTTQVVSRPDTAGILPAPEINSFFVGDSVFNLQVRPDLLNDPRLLAASRSGQPGDNTNLQRMVATQDALSMSNGSQTIGQFYGSMVGDIGTKVSELDQRQTNLLAEHKGIAGRRPHPADLPTARRNRSNSQQHFERRRAGIGKFAEPRRDRATYARPATEREEAQHDLRQRGRQPGRDQSSDRAEPFASDVRFHCPPQF
jgi:flagellar hook-associated protein FlgK